MLDIVDIDVYICASDMVSHSLFQLNLLIPVFAVPIGKAKVTFNDYPKMIVPVTIILLMFSLILNCCLPCNCLLSTD
jgi:hypothetical protein